MINLPPFFLLVLILIAGLYLCVFALAWKRRTRATARPLECVLWVVTAAACFASLTPRLSGALASLSTATHTWGGPISLVMLSGCALSVGKPGWIARNRTAQLLFVGIGMYSGVELISGLVNSEYPGHISIVDACYLAYLPTIYWLTADERFASTELLQIGRRICLAIVYSSLALAFLAPHVVFVGKRRLAIGPFHDRLAGITPHPNLLSAVAALGLLLSLHAGKNRYLTACLCLLTIGLAESREAAIALVACLLIYWLFSGRAATGRLLLAVPVLISLSLLLILTGGDSSSSSTSQLTADASSVDSRTRIWGLVIAHVGAKPTLGWGPFAFSDQVSTPFSLTQTLFLNAHNQFAQAVVEGGFLGLCALLAVVIAMVRIAWRARRNPVYPSAICFGLLMMVTEVPLTVHLYGMSFVIVVAWLIALVTIAGARSAANRVQSVSASREVPRTSRGSIQGALPSMGSTHLPVRGLR